MLSTASIDVTPILDIVCQENGAQDSGGCDAPSESALG